MQTNDGFVPMPKHCCKGALSQDRAAGAARMRLRFMTNESTLNELSTRPTQSS
jgi:hypothetical protein